MPWPLNARREEKAGSVMILCYYRSGGAWCRKLTWRAPSGHAIKPLMRRQNYKRDENREAEAKPAILLVL